MSNRLCQLCRAAEKVHPLPGCSTFITPGNVTADFFLEHETSYTQHKEFWVWECGCGAIEEERFKTWEECHKYTRDHWAGKLNELEQDAIDEMEKAEERRREL